MCRWRPNGVLGPWLPSNFITENAALADILNPFDATANNPVISANAHNGVFYTGLPGDLSTGFSFNPGDIDPINEPDKNFEKWILDQTFQSTQPKRKPLI